MKKNNETWILESYEITSDPIDELDEVFGITAELKRNLENYARRAMQGKKKDIPFFLNLIEKYPKNPQLKNYLSSLYANNGNIPKAREVNHWILAEHPEYLFARVNYANELIENKEYDKVREALGQSLSLKALYPERTVFNVAEVSSYHLSLVRYYMGLDDIDQAQKNLDFLSELGVDEFNQENVERVTMSLNILKAKKRFEAEEKQKITPVTTQNKPKIPLAKEHFNYPELEEYVYHQDGLSQQELETISRLDSILVHQDLNLMYHQICLDFEGHAPQETDGVIHIFNIITYHPTKSNLKLALDILHQSEKFLDWYLGYYTTEYLWNNLLPFVKDYSDVLFDFVCQPGLDTYAKDTVSTAIAQAVHHGIILQEDSISWHKKLLDFHLTTNIDNVLDTVALGCIVSSIIDIGGKQLLPQIKQLYELGMVSPSVCGDFKAVSREISDSINPKNKRERHTVFEIYDDMMQEKPLPFANQSFSDNLSKLIHSGGIASSKKTGRNDACPCGSGKKYKKCCLESGVYE